ncbi:hypothetical protein [uncultured Aquimarina sp.]|uniref:hypothetical protein n=1 Tax=uncultured Aquimarina sp. TaxID=575652 RepID=UPI0026176801|nr:hypothetical protein [uncultured Aquimarina sp.]
MKTNDINLFLGRFEINLGLFYFYKNYIIAEIKEGEIISVEKLDQLMPLILKYYKNGSPFTYISNRINPHSINPLDYIQCPFIYLENFIGYSAIHYNEITRKSIEIEKYFAQRPFSIFNNIDDAIRWTYNEVIE